MKTVKKMITWLILPLMLLACEKGEPLLSIKWPQLVSTKRSVGSVFMLILNDGSGEDILVGCGLKGYPGVVCELHDIQGGRMKKVQKMVIRSNSELELKPGSKHLMLFGLPDDLPEKVTIVLQFQRSGEIEITAGVKRL